MINITKQGNNVIVTSDNPNSFHIGNGELSVPLNTIYYVLDDESDFIQFNSTEEGNILFNGTIGQIQVNGNIVNRENILMELDNVFNSATGGGGSSEPATEYVKTVTTDNFGSIFINNNDGTSDRIVFPLINGQQILGNGGNIEMKKFFSRFYVFLVLLFMYAPIFVLIAFSFNESKGRSWTGFSFKWYGELFRDDAIIGALGNTLIIAIVAAVVGIYVAVTKIIEKKKLKNADDRENFVSCSCEDVDFISETVA